MRLIPEVKKSVKGKRVEFNGCKFEFPENCDKRLLKLAERIPDGEKCVEINISKENGEGYAISFAEKITVDAKGVNGAFYAMQTIRQLIKNGYYDFESIEDEPDFEARGFYYDITRGRVATLETLKKLVDNLAYYKINMLQLYVEHVFPFKEYDGIYQWTGYITPEEIRELDAYCYENFIDFVPSLSCFGHLYELLQTERYKELCELVDYEPVSIYWRERMAHHTINPADARSIEIIKSLIDQYAPLFTSNYFNICCDETFDLGTDRNKGKDKGRLYVDFVKEIIKHIKSKGKIPMMWGDIINDHAELIPEIDDDTVFLSWGYSANPSPDCINKVEAAGRKQYVCPGCSNWTSLIEHPEASVPNITKMVDYGYKAGAKGVLNTCWGDYGQISPIYACMYGAIFGAAKSWNATCDYDGFDKAIDLHYYGYEGAADIVKKIAMSYKSCYWYELLTDYSNRKFNNSFMKSWNTASPDSLNEAFAECEEIVPYLMATKWENDEAREALLVVTQGTECMIAMLMSMQTGEKIGVNLADAEQWLKDYSTIYLKESKMGELKEVVKIFYELAERYLA